MTLSVEGTKVQGVQLMGEEHEEQGQNYREDMIKETNTCPGAAVRGSTTYSPVITLALNSPSSKAIPTSGPTKPNLEFNILLGKEPFILKCASVQAKISISQVWQIEY